LTIGRTPANTVALVNDDTVDRAHARIEIAGDGSARICCIDPRGTLEADGSWLRELPLDAGVHFSIGRTKFECVHGQHGPHESPARSATTCPECGLAEVPVDAEGIRRCPGCDQPILTLWLGPRERNPLVLPTRYGRATAARYVARGGMGLVLQGKRQESGELVAIKVILSEPHDDGRGEEWF
jgi:hypothetical protein